MVNIIKERMEFFELAITLHDFDFGINLLFDNLSFVKDKKDIINCLFWAENCLKCNLAN